MFQNFFDSSENFDMSVRWLIPYFIGKLHTSVYFPHKLILYSTYKYTYIK